MESEELPMRTLVAPPILARELRLALEALDLTIQTGTRDAVLISSDLFHAFQEWNAAEDETPDAEWN
ncbi:MAG: hypothetical protein KF861_04795 [Planctomycetaceae bacterium]|nr:hypothetical protein [Planctomycetaceae bacterium]